MRKRQWWVKIEDSSGEHEREFNLLFEDGIEIGDVLQAVQAYVGAGYKVVKIDAKWTIHELQDITDWIVSQKQKGEPWS